MLEVLELFLRVAVCHNVAIHPGREKCVIFVKETVYWGLKIRQEGITVDPVRINGLKNIQQPHSVGDVWQFNAGANWIREDIPLLSTPAATLSARVSCKSVEGEKETEHAGSQEDITSTSRMDRETSVSMGSIP